MSKLLTLLTALALEKFTVEFFDAFHNAVGITMSYKANHIQRAITQLELTTAVDSDELVMMHLREMMERLQHAANAKV